MSRGAAAHLLPALSISECVPGVGSMAHRGLTTHWCSSPRPVPERLLSEACPPRPPHPPLPILILPGYSSRLGAVSGESKLTPPQRCRNAGLWNPAKAGSWPSGYCRGACPGQHAPQPPETAFLEPNVCLLVLRRMGACVLVSVSPVITSTGNSVHQLEDYLCYVHAGDGCSAEKRTKSLIHPWVRLRRVVKSERGRNRPGVVWFHLCDRRTSL